MSKKGRKIMGRNREKEVGEKGREWERG